MRRSAHEKLRRKTNKSNRRDRVRRGVGLVLTEVDAHIIRVLQFSGDLGDIGDVRYLEPDERAAVGAAINRVLRNVKLPE